jgi:hypothetical protein
MTASGAAFQSEKRHHLAEADVHPDRPHELDQLAVGEVGMEALHEVLVHTGLSSVFPERFGEIQRSEFLIGEEPGGRSSNSAMCSSVMPCCFAKADRDPSQYLQVLSLAMRSLESSFTLADSRPSPRIRK